MDTLGGSKTEELIEEKHVELDCLNTIFLSVGSKYEGRSLSALSV